MSDYDEHDEDDDGRGEFPEPEQGTNDQEEEDPARRPVTPFDDKFAPLFQHGDNYGIIGDEKFTASDAGTAQKIGETRIRELNLLGFSFTGDVVVIPAASLRNVHSKVGPHTFCILKGPVYDQIREKELREKEAAKKAGA